MNRGQAAEDFDQWHRIDLRSERCEVRVEPQVKVAIQTRGPSMQGIIRIPGAPASNFDTGMGLTVVDLINVPDGARGSAEIFAVEILITQKMPEQFYQVFLVDHDRGNSHAHPATTLCLPHD